MIRNIKEKPGLRAGWRYQFDWAARWFIFSQRGRNMSWSQNCSWLCSAKYF